MGGSSVQVMSKRATLFIGVTAAIGVSVFAYALAHWQSTGLERFACYLIIAVLSSGLKIQLPGIDGTMSVNFLRRSCNVSGRRARRLFRPRSCSTSS